MDIQFYDFEFNVLLQSNKYISSKWDIYYNDIGTWEAHFALTSDIMILVINNQYLVARQNGQAAIVIGYDTQNDFVVYGRTCNWLLSKRVTKSFAQLTGTVDTLARGFVSTAFNDVSNFILGPEAGITETVDFVKDSDTITSDTVIECLKLQNCGHSVDFDVVNKQWVYRTLVGHNPDLVVSEANRNAYDTKITHDLLDYADCGYYSKETTTTDSDGNDDTATETTYLSTENTETGIKRWETLLGGKSETESLSDLNTKSCNDEITLETRNIKFGIDYNLGDIIRIQIIKGTYRTTTTKRVSGVEIWYQQGGYGEKPIFADTEI